MMNLMLRNILVAWIAAATSGMLAAQTLNLSDLPLGIQSEIPSNVVVSLDDSGSMAWGWMPDGVNANWQRTFYRSSHHNKIFYDPTVNYVPPSTSTGSSLPDADFNAAIRGYYYDSGNQYTVDLSQDFSAVYYHYSSGARIMLGDNAVASYGCLPAVCADEPAYYYQYDDTLAGCAGNDDAKEILEACYRKVVITDAANYSGGTNNQGRTQAEEQTNFANWYQYYLLRNEAAKSAVQRAFIPGAIDGSVRVARQAFNTDRAIQSGTPAQDNNTIAEFDDTERAGFYEWVRQVPTNGGTPLRNTVYRAGEYFKTDNAYFTNPETSSGDLVGCRVNTHILVTDGFYNGSFTAPAGFQLDQAATTLPDGEIYTPGTDPIYRNALDSQSISDLAFHYWATDLRPGNNAAAANNITPFKSSQADDPDDYWDPRNDPATWQHMNSFAIAFGAESNVPADEATYKQLKAGTRTWPQSFPDTPSAIDDLYHSGINGRGDFFNAGNPDELVDALDEITSRLGERTGTAPEVGSTSGRITSESSVFIAAYDTDTWSGDIQAYKVSDGSESGKPGASGCNAKPLGTLCGDINDPMNPPEWSAAQRNEKDDLHMLPANRVILSYNPALAEGSRGIEFLFGNLDPATQQAALNQSDGLGQQRLDYVRGDDSNEKINGGPFRTRMENSGGQVTRVPAIVHSIPVYAGEGGSSAELRFRFPKDLEGPANAPVPYTIPSRDDVVYVGGNDGMLHGYDASNGKEIFGYIPGAVMNTLHEMTDPGFDHGAYVDGLLDLQDAFVDGEWRTLLSGGLRSGGQGYFMLDVTDPPGSSSDPNDIVKWEFSDRDDADLGYTYGQPVIVKSNYNGGEWVVLLPSGYNSTENDGTVGTGEAFLYVLAADDGELLAKIGVGEGDLANPNGLSSPVAVSDTDIQHFAERSAGTDPDVWTVDYAYAGDLQGNLWKFDLSSTNENDWEAYLMFDTGGKQPITARPAVGSFPKRGDNGEEYRFVYFGTGKYIEPADVATTPGQTFYAFIDQDNCASSTTACVTDSDLVTQTINGQGVVSNNVFDANNDRGCKIDLHNSGFAERIINQPAVIANSVIFSSIEPNGEICKAGEDGYLYAVNRFTCGPTATQILDTNNDGEINNTDKSNGNVVARKTIAPGAPKIVLGAGDHIAGITTTGAEQLQAGDRKGRVRWRQIK